ncbi:MAG TPA: hypothetical protein VJY39_03065 [Acidisphaera sp.]|nr:hypothetical protein [Acidisphaera sp.]
MAERAAVFGPMPHLTPPEVPRVRGGQVIASRLYDVAYAIDLTRAERIWAERQPRVGARRARLVSTPSKAVDFGVPPVDLPLEPITLKLPGGDVEASASARLYDFGVVVLTLRVAAADLDWAAFVARVNAVAAAVDAKSAERPWPGLLDPLRATLAPAMDRPSAQTIEEDYLIGVVQGFDPPLAAAEVIERLDLIPLLTGEMRALSDAARAEVLRNRFGYYTDDLTVLTWDRAFLLEPRGETDVLDVLEVANAQLLEMRYYDELLDDELPRMYDLVEAARRTASLLSARRFAHLARRLYTLVAEATELAERVDNALQVTEDVYLARIYAAALNLFRVPEVNAAVNRKLALIRDTYTALYDEALSGRSELLEVLIVLLIIAEIALAIWRP